MTFLRSGLVLALVLRLSAQAAQTVLDQAGELEVRGAFKDAAAVLQTAIEKTGANDGERRQLRFELDRLDRIRKDFPHTEDALFAALEKSVKDLTREEFNAWVRENRFDSREIDGERRFMAASVSNLFFRYPELGPRRLPPKDNTGLSRKHLEMAREIRKAAQASGQPYVLPRRFEAVMTVTLKPDAVADNAVVSAWLPIPRRYPFQNEIKFRRSAPEPKQLASDLSPIRSVFMEQPARQGLPTVFSVEYEYTAYGVRFDIDPAAVKPSDPSDPQLAPFLAEGPHVVFSPEIRALSDKVLGGEKNPCLQSKRFFDWIAANIKYSYAIEYSTIRNISEYCRERGYGDCGQEALLFITLCRLNGIPARWQSGWSTFPGSKTIHDWAEIHLAPQGWVPVDPYMGIFAMRYATGLTPDEQRELRDSYFGGLDPYRMIANSDHSQVLAPPKKSMRSDTVDFQRGELECGDRNLYFDQYTYSLDIKEVSPQPAAKP